MAEGQMRGQQLKLIHHFPLTLTLSLMERELFAAQAEDWRHIEKLLIHRTLSQIIYRRFLPPGPFAFFFFNFDNLFSFFSARSISIS